MHPGCGKADVDTIVTGAGHKRGDVRGVVAELIGTGALLLENGDRGKHVLRAATADERDATGL